MRSVIRFIVGGIVGLMLLTGLSWGTHSIQAVATPAAANAAACAAALKPHLEVGKPAVVSKQLVADLPGAYLKAKPTHNGPVLRSLVIGTVVDVIGGPTCGTDKTWWYNVQIGELSGWVTESSAGAYLLEPFTDATRPAPPDTTLLTAIPCIHRNTPAAFILAGTPTVTRVAFATLDGSVQVSDNGTLGRTLATFSPPPFGVDLAPDGGSVLVATVNGLYWVDAQSGNTVLVLDNQMLNLAEGMWINRVNWLPDGKMAAIEIVDTRDNTTSVQIWAVPMDGSEPAFREDTLPAPESSIHRSPWGDHAVIVSAGDISPFPNSSTEDTKAYLEFVPKASSESGDAREIVAPAVSWSIDGKGFYTYIPVSDQAAPNDPVAGRIWYVSWDDQPKEIARLSGVKAADYVIPNRDGKSYLIGHGVTWTVRDLKGKELLTFQNLRYIFDWTPDGKGVVYSDKDGATKYAGLDPNDTMSKYVPDATNLYELKWLADGTLLYVAQGKDGKLSFSTQKPGDKPAFMGLVNTEYSFAALELAAAPDKGDPLQSCVAPATSAATAAVPATAPAMTPAATSGS
jgi:hypothetical protein